MIGIDVFIPVLLLIGFSVSVISAFLGIGAAWLVTPVLNIIGFPMAFAVGTDIAHMGVKGFLATLYHSQKKHVDYHLAFFMLIGTVIGVELGAQVVMYLEQTSQLEQILRCVYIVLLTGVSFVVLFHKRTQKTLWTENLQTIFPPPFVFFKISQLRCSVWLPILIGLFSGFLAGFLGIGGGLLRLPM